MKMKKIPIHSMTDLITNSSTTIFTYSGGSVEAVKEMINEFFKVLRVEKTFDEVFNAVVLCEEAYYYENNESSDKVENLKQLYEDVKVGKVNKPEWFNEVEEDTDYSDGFTPSTYLYLVPKKEEYEKLGESIENFLYSTDHEGTFDG